MKNFGKSLSVWWRLARGEHALMSFLAVVASAVIATNTFSTSYLFFALGPAMIVLASFVFNDYCDLPSDRALGRRERPLVSKQVPAKAAFVVAAAFFVLGLLLCFFASTLAFEIALVYSLLSIAYSLFLKKLPLVGNAVTATTYAISFLYGNAVAVNSIDLAALNPLVVYFAGFAFLAGIGRELLITLRDVEGDRKIGALTLPMVLGAMPTIILSSVFFLAAVALTFLAFNSIENFVQKIVFALFVGACDALLLYSTALSCGKASEKSFSKIRDYTLKAFQLALLGFFLLAALSIT